MTAQTTGSTARQHANAARNAAGRAFAAAKDAENDRAAAAKAATASDAQRHADDAARAAQTAQDASASAAYHAALAEELMNRLVDDAARTNDPDDVKLGDDAESAWYDAARDARDAALDADIAARHAARAKTTAKQAWQLERIRKQEEKAAARDAARDAANAATDAAIKTGQEERDAHAALLDMANAPDTAFVDMAERANLLHQCANAYRAAIAAHAAALLKEQDAWDAARRLDADVTADSLSYVAKAKAIARR